MFFTKKNDTAYMFYAYKDLPELPPKISFHMELPVKEITSIRTGVSVQFRQQDNTVTLFTGSIPPWQCLLCRRIPHKIEINQSKNRDFSKYVPVFHFPHKPAPGNCCITVYYVIQQQISVHFAECKNVIRETVSD